MNINDLLTFNQWVADSNPARLTTNIKGLAEKRWAFCVYGFQMGSKKRLFDGECPLISQPFIQRV